MANMGALVVSLEANIAKFTSDMGKAAKTTEDAMGKINGAVSAVKGALASLGVGVSVGAFAALVKGSIDAADNLRDMSQKSGVAIETLNGLGFAAGQAGGNLQSVVAAAGKLNKSIVEAAGGNKDTGEAFSKLGISVRDAAGQLKSADVVMAEVADRFKGYADGPEKSEIALRIFGKAGADMIPVLNDGGDSMRENIEYAKKYSGVTRELAEASDNFNDTMGKLAIQQKSFGNAMATAVLPVLQAVANEYLAASENSDKFKLAGEAVRTTLEAIVITGSEVAFTFKSIGREIGAWLAQADALGVSLTDMAGGAGGVGAALAKSAVTGKISFAGFSAISDAVKADAEQARKEHDAFIASILDRTPPTIDANGSAKPDKPKPRAPTLRAKGDDPAKAIMDGQLKALENAYASERNVATFHNQFMDSLRGQGLVDLESYEAFKKASIEQGLASAIKTYDAEIAAIEKKLAVSGKETEREEARSAIKDKLAQKDKARVDAAQANAMLDLNNAKVRKDLVNKWQAESDALDKQNETNFLNLRKSLLTVTETENEAYQERIDEFVKFKNTQLANEELGNEMIEREKKRHAEAIKGIQLSGSLEVLSLAGNSSDQLYSLMKTAGMEQSALGRALFVANKAIAIAEIIMNTEVAAAKALTMGPLVGPPLAMAIRVMGYASAGIVLGTTIASAERGFDIPAGRNPVTQLHEKEMVLPRAQADVIRGLAANGGKGGTPAVTYAPVIQIDSRSDQAQVRQLVSNAVAQGNADLVDKLQRAGRI